MECSAQAHRLNNDEESALKDLNHAIEFGHGSYQTLKQVWRNEQSKSQNDYQFQAYTQRAIIHKKRGDLAQAELDFEKGAQFGNEIAMSVVKSNPYAKLQVSY